MDKIPNTLFCCPICKKPLRRDGKSSRCAARHCFDIASGGYVHLLPTNQMNSNEPGDDKGMVVARSRFLAKSYSMLSKSKTMAGVAISIVISVLVLVAAHCLCWGLDIYKIGAGHGMTLLDAIVAVPQIALSEGLVIGFFRG